MRATADNTSVSGGLYGSAVGPNSSFSGGYGSTAIGNGSTVNGCAQPERSDEQQLGCGIAVRSQLSPIIHLSRSAFLRLIRREDGGVRSPR